MSMDWARADMNPDDPDSQGYSPRRDPNPEQPVRHSAPRKPRVLVDFDGVIHRYSRGWQDGSIYDGLVPGAVDSLDRLLDLGYEVVIFSTRPGTQIAEWLTQRWPRGDAADVVITDRKMPAVALIDDRAVRFTDWPSALAELVDRYPVRP